MSSPATSVDEATIATTIQNLSDKITSEQTKLQNLQTCLRMLNQIKQVVASTTQKPDGTTTNTFGNPIDTQTGIQMTDARRLELYNIAIPKATEALSS